MSPRTDLLVSDVAGRIKQTFESQLYQLPPRVQGHYALRLFRITGDPRYLNATLYDYYAITDRINAALPHLNDSAYIARETEKLVSNISNGKRGRARRKLQKKFPGFIFYSTLLEYAARLDEYGVSVPVEVISALAKYDFETIFTDMKMIEAWAAQLSNYVYWLRQLGIADHTITYKSAFLKTYPDVKDNKLSRWQFKNKLYGLTHFIFAASEYYQHSVIVTEFDWILKYFADNQQRILENTSADIMAEVAISFLLVEQYEHALITKIKNELLLQYDVDHAMIPSVSGKIDLATGEHRNVLTLMLFNWPEKLTPGPCILHIKSIEKYLPKSPTNWNPAASKSRCDPSIPKNSL